MRTFKTVVMAALLTVALIGGTDAAQASMAVSFTSPSNLYQDLEANNNNIIGWSFTANTDLRATKLAVFDSGQDSSPENSHFIGLWNSAGNLMASATASGSGSVPGFFRWADIASTSLTAGETYYVGAIMGKDYYTSYVPESLGFGLGAPTSFANLVIADSITFQADAFYYLASGETLDGITFGSTSLTTGITGAQTVIGGFGANIDAAPVPIPGAIYLLGSGLIGLIGVRRRTNR